MVQRLEPAKRKKLPVTTSSTSLATRNNKQTQGDHPVWKPWANEWAPTLLGKRNWHGPHGRRFA